MVSFKVIPFWKNQSIIFDGRILWYIAQRVEHYTCKQYKGIIHIVCVSRNAIKTWNARYRNKNTVTDILSFSYHQEGKLHAFEEVLWEMLLCPSYIEKQSYENACSLEEKFYFLIIHGTLHIFWYDHEEEEEAKIMKNLEECIWKEVQTYILQIQKNGV